MTGPEHYREAERLLARFDEITGARTFANAGKALGLYLSAAQIHATLALAAATATAAFDRTAVEDPIDRAWRKAMGDAS